LIIRLTTHPLIERAGYGSNGRKILDPNKGAGPRTFQTDRSTGRITRLSDGWKTNNYYYSLDEVYRNHIYSYSKGYRLFGLLMFMTNRRPAIIISTILK
jgi:hypothetical protein